LGVKIGFSMVIVHDFKSLSAIAEGLFIKYLLNTSPDHNLLHHFNDQ